MPPYADGTFGADLGGRNLRLFDGFAKKQEAILSLGGIEAAIESGRFTAEEAMSVSDFGTYMNTILRKTFLGTWDEVQGAWGEYTHDMPLDDFEQYTSYRWGRFPDWPQRPLGSDIEQLGLKEYPGPAVQLIEFAAGFTVTRRLILADRAQRIAQLPAALGEAGARTQSKRAVSQLESNPTMFDGNAWISAAHNNLGSTALTRDQAGVNALRAAFDAIEAQTDDEGYKIALGGGDYVLLVPRALQWIARALAERDELPQGSATTDLMRPNDLVGRFRVVVDPFLTDVTNWYLFLNPRGPQGALAALNLNGQTRPSLFQKDERKVGILGSGDDPYTWRWDELEYIGRHDFDFQPTEFRTLFGAIVAG